MLKYFDRLKKFDYLVRHSITGTPSECAKKLEISRSRFYEFLDDLKLMEIPVEYHKSRRTYSYTKPGKIKIGFEEKSYSINSSLERVVGGAISTSQISFFNVRKYRTHIS